jgi:hypothetical protein
VLEAGVRFQAANDFMAQFVADQTQAHADGRVQSSRLYSAYMAWCRRNGHPALSGVRAASDWHRLGFERKRIDGKSFWCGLALNPQPAEEDDEDIPPMSPELAAYTRQFNYLRKMFEADEAGLEFDYASLPIDILELLGEKGKETDPTDTTIADLIKNSRLKQEGESKSASASIVDPTL